MTKSAIRRAEDLKELPSREPIAAAYLQDETALVNALIGKARASKEERPAIDAVARSLAEAARAGRRKFGGIDAFMHEYGLSSAEGVMLMCLAEALLRIPDANTADRLIADKIGGGDWARHVGHSESLLVNASSWGLMLTGRVIDLGAIGEGDPGQYLKSLVARLGEPVIREAMRHAMGIMGQQFVLGRTIAEALANAKSAEAEGYRLSYDMLGEAARTRADAERYFADYRRALEAVLADARPANDRNDETLFERPGLSVKLSALHQRFEPSQERRVLEELVPRLAELAGRARAAWLTLIVDAEEADRLELTLEVFAQVCRNPALAGWNGFGLAVQAYGKRALPTLDWLSALGRDHSRRIPVRLVKGAYWDAEIKFAQEAGLSNYPVFTRKANTDISYLACVRRLFDEPERFYPQFATHNAHTIASVVAYAKGNTDYEFQRLHGMGQALYEEVIGVNGLGRPARIYAPVGGHEDLLAYLARRLLENGSNTSFVHRLADDEAPLETIIADPMERMLNIKEKSHPRIALPRNLYQPGRLNSLGLPLWEAGIRAELLEQITDRLAGPVMASPIIGGEPVLGGSPDAVHSPHDRRAEVGRCVSASESDIHRALSQAASAAEGWDRRGGDARAEFLERAADLIEEDRAGLMAIMVREAGKTLQNALDEVREAVDFLRYYAHLARTQFTGPIELPGPTGEENRLHLRGRGVFACISPWNFPLAIFVGQVAAGLAAGNAVVAKPAEQTPLTAHLAVRLLHLAGVPSDVLHFLPGPGEQVGAALVGDPRVEGIAFTGSNETAALINSALAARPGPITPLIAETGGINAMIVDSSALPEQVVRDVLRSAFDSAGQRCSALRVLCLQDNIAERTLSMLTGAMEELSIGDPMDYATDVGPVIDAEAVTALEGHKALMRRMARVLLELPLPLACEHGTYVAPAAYEINGVEVLEREVFGPILHVVRFAANRLEDLCRSINGTGYALTLGIHSRIGSTVERIAETVRAGNIYVNRNQVGAVVGVQPFGGQGLSGTGPKAGGPHTLLRYAVERSRATDLTAGGGNAALLSLDPGSDRARDD